LAQAIRGVGLTVETIDLGGGLGVTYRDEAPPSVSDYAALAEAELGGLGCRLLLEPGRSIVASAGILLTRVTYRKDGGPRDIVILDAGMNDLARPSLYDAYHALTPVAQPRPDAPLGEIDVVGPICETGDSFARARALPRLESEDLVAIEMAGAYGSSMSSNYNARPLAAEVLVRGEQWSIVRRRQAVEALFSDETIPDWVGES
jgi:diaminopimelate decarboxylase